MKKHSAFTLLELSIVIILIGILVGGVMKGGNLINSARLTSARSFTSKSPVPEIEGLIAWYETSSSDSFKASETVDGIQATEWRDISPNSVVTQKNKLTKAAAANMIYESTGINKTPSLQFSSTGKITLSSLYQGGMAQATVFLVFRPNVAPSSGAIILFDSISTVATNTSIGIKSTAVNLNAGLLVDTGVGSNPASFANGKNYIVAAYLNGVKSGAYVNNATTLAGGANVSAGTNQITGLTIGTDKGGSNGFTGLISEVIIYNRPLKLQERKDVMLYLSKKYRITVSGL